MTPGTGPELRERVQRELRRRTVVAVDPRARVEMTAQYRDLDAPIFIPGAEFGRISRVAAIAGADVWFLGPQELPTDFQEGRA